MPSACATSRIERPARWRNCLRRRETEAESGIWRVYTHSPYGARFSSCKSNVYSVHSVRSKRLLARGEKGLCMVECPFTALLAHMRTKHEHNRMDAGRRQNQILVFALRALTRARQTSGAAPSSQPI